MKPAYARALAGLLYPCFFISGMLGLLYEVVWAKYLELFIGATSYANTIVLGTFMGGLALGSYLFGRLADKASRKLSIYGWLELLIGLYCLAFPVLVEVFSSAYVSVARATGAGAVAVLLMKVALSVLLILVPTTMMGGTLPALTRFFVGRLSEVRGGVALLYALNSLGGVAGTILAGFWMIKTYGLPSTMRMAALCNVVVGAAALIICYLTERRGAEPFAQPDLSPSPGQVPEAVFPKRVVRIAMICAGLTGMAAMIYEIAWIRLLALVQGSSTYTFTMMLVAFIAGIAIGSFLVNRLVKNDRSNFLLAGTIELLIAMSLIATLPFYERIPFYLNKAAGLLVKKDEAFAVYQLFNIAFNFGIMIVPTTLMGMVLPLLSRVASNDIRVLGRDIGSIFAVNTVGTLLGAILGGFLLLPLLGLQRTFEFAMGLNIAMGLIIVVPGPRGRWTLPAALAVPAVFIAFLAFNPQWSREVFAIGDYRYLDISEPTYEEFKKRKMGNEILYYKDGQDCTVAVTRYRPTGDRALIINGKPDASSAVDLPTQLLLGHVPMIMHPGGKDVLVIGMGSGVTAGAVLMHSGARVDQIEISPEVVEASRLFSIFNNNVHSNPRFRLVLEDAKTHLKITPRKYDVILSEPTNIWISGMSKLFSNEFYADIASRLNDGGVVAQWIHAYDMDDELLSLILRTFAKHFPHMEVWNSLRADFIIVGSRRPLNVDLERSSREFDKPEVRRNLGKVKISEFTTLLGLQMLTGTETARLAASPGAVYSDYHPVVEYEAPRHFFTHSSATLFPKNDSRARIRNGSDPLYLETWEKSHPLSEARYHDLINYYMKWTDPIAENLVNSIHRRLIGMAPEDQAAKEWYLRFLSDKGWDRREAAAIKADPVIAGEQKYRMVLFRERVEDFGRAASIFNKEADLKTAAELRGECEWFKADYAAKCRKLVAGVEISKGLLDEAAADLGIQISLLRTMTKKQELSQALIKLGGVWLSKGDNEKAREYMEDAVKTDPENYEARKALEGLPR